MASFVSVVPLYDLVGCGEVEMLLHFCSFVSKGLSKPYHVEFLEKVLHGMVRIWPVFLQNPEIKKLLRRTYNQALRKHFHENRFGPRPGRITFWPNSVRYTTSHGATITLAHLPSGLPVLVVQTCTEHQMFKYVGYRSVVTRIKTSWPLSSSEVLNEPFYLRDMCLF